MLNPILQNLNNGNMMSKLNMLSSLMEGKNPTDVYNQLMQSNPKFAQFVKDNYNKTPEQIAMDNGIDPSILKFLR